MQVDIFSARKKVLVEYMQSHNIDAIVLQDSEAARSSHVFYLCNMAEDTILLLDCEGRVFLSAWDQNLASEQAVFDLMVTEKDAPRSLESFFTLLAKMPQAKHIRRVELAKNISYPDFIHLQKNFPAYNFLCESKGFQEVLEKSRQIKDDYEVKKLKESAQLTNQLIEELQLKIKQGGIREEYQAALYIQKFAMEQGCEGTSFPTLAAGPARSWQIHCTPSAGKGEFGGQGFSILDFGLRKDHYCTDVTFTLVKSPLSSRQQKMLDQVLEMESRIHQSLKPGISMLQLKEKITEVLEPDWHMPHNPGHGIGLDVHEWPFFNSETVLQSNMLLALEPALYHPEEGGIRFENDFLLTETGYEKLTSSQLLFL